MNSAPSKSSIFLLVKNRIVRLFQGQFIRNVAIVASGTAGAQAITMAFSPIITRLYGPEAFGLLGTFMAIVGIVTPIAALSYPIAIVLPQEDRDAKGIARLSIYLALSIALLVTVLLLVGGDWLVGILKAQEIASFIFLIPLVIVSTAWLQINQQWLVRKKEFAITARVVVLQAFILNSAKSGIGFFKPLGAVLIVLATLGNALHAFMLNYGARRIESVLARGEKQSFSALWGLAKKHYDFPCYRAPQVFINAVSHSLPVLMLAAFFSPASAGFYALGMRVLGLPSQLIGQAVGNVFYPRIAEAAHNGEKPANLILKATMALAGAGFFPFALIIAFGPWLFGFVFGNEWVIAGEYARWLALWSFFGFINRPSVAAIPVLRLQGFFLGYEIVSVLLRATALYVGFYIFKSDLFAICLFSWVGVFLNLSLVGLTILASCEGRNNKKAP